MFDLTSFFSEKESKNGYFVRKFRKSDGNKGIEETVRLMVDMKDHYKQDIHIRTFVLKQLVNDDSIGGDRNVVNAERIYELLLNRIRYIPDILDVETIQSPYYTWKYRAGDCDDMALIGAVFLETIGIRTHFVIVGRGTEYTHIYLYFENLRGDYIPFDLTRKRFGWEEKRYTLKKIY